jgi:lysophospholipase L1-like esterase
VNLKPLSLRFTLCVAVLASLAGSCRNPVVPPIDPPPPVAALSLACPPVVTARVDQGAAVVVYPAPVTSGGSAPIDVTCTIPSGGTFPAGSTDVICTARDSVAQSAQCVFKVEVNLTARLRGTKFLAFGDSITWGEVSQAAVTVHPYDPFNNYPVVLLDLLRARYVQQANDVVVTNSGVQGEKVIDSEDRLVADVARYAPDVLLLLHGANDVNAGTSPTALGRSIRANVRRALDRGVKVVLLSTLLPQVEGRSKAFNPDGILDANEEIRDAAQREGAVLVDSFAVFNPQKQLLLGEDGLHPTVAGYKLLAETVLAAIKANFEVPPAAGAPTLLSLRRFR